jgi:radical SAM-linked protein
MTRATMPGKLLDVAGRSQPEQHAPPVQRLRVRYAKRGRARFLSSRDFSRALERGLRRARVPMAYSSGFSPHPRISYANSVPTGAASEAEYLEIGLAEPCDPKKVQAALNAALPAGLDILEVVSASPTPLSDVLTGSVWRIDLVGVSDVALKRAVGQFLAASSVPVTRMTKNGLREFDARNAVLSLSIDGTSLYLMTAHSAPLVRPDDVIAALSRLASDFRPTDVLFTRLRQGTVNSTTGELDDPASSGQPSR